MRPWHKIRFKRAPSIWAKMELDFQNFDGDAPRHSHAEVEPKADFFSFAVGVFIQRGSPPSVTLSFVLPLICSLSV